MKRLFNICLIVLTSLLFFYILKDFHNRHNPVSLESSDNFKIKVESFLMEFKQDLKAYSLNAKISDIKFEMFKPNNTINGLCHEDKKIIQLAENFSKTTFYHEMGHCVFGASHLMVYNNKGNSESIMAWNNNDQDKHIEENWNHYKHKFFTQDIHTRQSRLEMFYGYFIKNGLINKAHNIKWTPKNITIYFLFATALLWSLFIWFKHICRWLLDKTKDSKSKKNQFK